MKTLRTLVAEALDGLTFEPYAPGAFDERGEVVEAGVRATRDWLAQAGILVTISNGLAETGTVGGAALALRREAVR